MLEIMGSSRYQYYLNYYETILKTPRVHSKYIPEVRGDIEAGVLYNYRYSCIRQLFLQCTYLYLVYTLPVIKSFRPGLLYCTTGGNLADQVCCTAMLEEVLVLQTGSTVP